MTTKNALCDIGYGLYCRDCELEAACSKEIKTCYKTAAKAEPKEVKRRVCGCTRKPTCPEPNSGYWVEPDPPVWRGW